MGNYIGNNTVTKEILSDTKLYASLLNKEFKTKTASILEYNPSNWRYTLYPLDMKKSYIKYNVNSFYYHILDPITFKITNIEKHRECLDITVALLEDKPLKSIVATKQQMLQSSTEGKNTSDIWYDILPAEINHSSKLVVSNGMLITKDLTVHFNDYHYFNTSKSSIYAFDLNQPATPNAHIESFN